MDNLANARVQVKWSVLLPAAKERARNDLKSHGNRVPSAEYVFNDLDILCDITSLFTGCYRLSANEDLCGVNELKGSSQLDGR